MKKYISGFKLNCLKQTSLSRERFDNNPSMTNIFTKPCENKTVPIRNLSRKIITKFHLLIKLQTYKMPNVAKGKRKGSEVTTPSGLTPKNKTTNTGMFNFDIQIASNKSVGYNNSTDHGKAVFKNNKENGSHLLAQPDRTNVQTKNLSDPQHIFIHFPYLYLHIFIKSEI